MGRRGEVMVVDCRLVLGGALRVCSMRSGLAWVHGLALGGSLVGGGWFNRDRGVWYVWYVHILLRSYLE